jgi:hypothetical protein
MDLSFAITAGPRQLSHSRVRVPRDSWPYFTVSNSKLPQPGGLGSRIYIPQEQGGPVIPPGTTGFLFRRLLRLARLRWRYLNPPPHGLNWTELTSVGRVIQHRSGPNRKHRYPVNGPRGNNASCNCSTVGWHHRLRDVFICCVCTGHNPATGLHDTIYLLSISALYCMSFKLLMKEWHRLYLVLLHVHGVGIILGRYRQQCYRGLKDRMMND